MITTLKMSLQPTSLRADFGNQCTPPVATKVIVLFTIDIENPTTVDIENDWLKVRSCLISTVIVKSLRWRRGLGRKRN